MNIENVEERFEKYEKDSIVQNLIAQADSRFILYMAREPTENFPNYSYMLDEKCLHIAFSYLEMGWDFLVRTILVIVRTVLKRLLKY